MLQTTTTTDISVRDFGDTVWDTTILITAGTTRGITVGTTRGITDGTVITAGTARGITEDTGEVITDTIITDITAAVTTIRTIITTDIEIHIIPVAPLMLMPVLEIQAETDDMLLRLLAIPPSGRCATTALLRAEFRGTVSRRFVAVRRKQRGRQFPAARHPLRAAAAMYPLRFAIRAEQQAEA